MQIVEIRGEEQQSREDAVPIQALIVDVEMNATLWVHSNIIRLNNLFGVDFLGCEKEALALFMKIDSGRKPSKTGAEKAIATTPKFKGMHEVKGLVINMKFNESGKVQKQGESDN